MHAFLCWPFSSKGHFHLPNALAPVLMDIKVRYQKQKSSGGRILYLSDSWNIQGKYTTRFAIERIENKKFDSYNINYEWHLNHNLDEILATAKEIADENIRKTKIIKSKLGTLESGIYGPKSFTPVEFRDDSEESWETTQKRFLDYYKRDYIYLKRENKKPAFYLKINKLYAEKTPQRLLENTQVPKTVSKIYLNNYQIYNKDLPLSTTGGYATPVPMLISRTGKVKIPEETSLPFDPRKHSKHQNYNLVIKPLFNIYTFVEALAGKFGHFKSVRLANDAGMITRINFVEQLIAQKSWDQKNSLSFGR